MSRKEDLARLEQAIDELKPEYREVIVLTRIEGLSYQEVGNRLSKNSEAVRKLVFRAMSALTRIYEAI
jgi:RNA polymerase sigma-70 factor (ECF subfamily)